MVEKWVNIENHPSYFISNFGRVFSKKSNKVMKNRVVSKNGYQQITLDNSQLLVHRLVAQAFIPNPNNLPCVNHKDENPGNNDFRNLEWCTYKYNSNYGTIKQRLSKSLSGENNGMYGKSPANKGVAMSDEQKEKLRLSHLGNNKGRHWKLIDGKRVWYD